MTASVTQTMDDARAAMAGLAENMDAMKHNFLLRGFFKGAGLLTTSRRCRRRITGRARSPRAAIAVWSASGGASDALFEPQPDHPADERLTEPGQDAGSTRRSHPIWSTSRRAS